MKAVLCQTYGALDDLVFTDLPRPEDLPGQIIVEIRACAVSFPDTLIVQGKYQMQPDLPFIPGREFAGIVHSVGEGVTSFAPGDRVMGFSYWGAFTEFVQTDPAHLHHIPDSLDFPTASTLMLTYSSALYALHYCGNLQAEETVLVLGAAGGMGLAAIQIAQIMGARVLAAVSTQEKVDSCLAEGAHEAFIYAHNEMREKLKTLTEGRGINLVFDPVGGEYAEAALRALAWGGRYLVVGFASGKIPSLPANIVLLKGGAILGAFWEPYARQQPQHQREALHALLQWHQQGRLVPHISRTYPLSSAIQALNTIEDRTAIGKVVLLVP